VDELDSIEGEFFTLLDQIDIYDLMGRYVLGHPHDFFVNWDSLPHLTSSRSPARRSAHVPSSSDASVTGAGRPRLRSCTKAGFGDRVRMS